MNRYGMFIGRFQPFHNGHKFIVDSIINDNLIPLILIGSAQCFRTQKNPFSFIERKAMILNVFPNAIIEPLPDFENNDRWISYIKNIVKFYKNVTMYVHNKESERGKYTDDKNIFISDLLIDPCLRDPIQHKTISITHENIDATTIRQDIEQNKNNLPKNVLLFLKENNLLHWNHLYCNEGHLEKCPPDTYLASLPDDEIRTYYNHPIYGGIDFYIK